MYLVALAGAPERTEWRCTYIAKTCAPSKMGKRTKTAPWAVLHSSVVSAKTGPRTVVATDTMNERAKASSSSIFENERRSPSQPTPEMRAMKLWYLSLRGEKVSVRDGSSPDAGRTSSS